MGQVQHTMRPMRAGRLKWTAITSGQAQRFERQQAKSPCPLAPDFLRGLPPVGADYQPREAITQKLKNLINDYEYTEEFEQAIHTVCQQGIPELDQIQTLDQFYFLVDAFSGWIPELRVWEWKENIYHERTDYLRITQFYYYFN
jgi:phosphatidylserine decarboxylase